MSPQNPQEPMMKVSITSVRETIKLNVRNELVRFTIVEYMLDDKYGPITFEEQKNLFAYEHVHEDARRHAAGIRGLKVV